MQKERRGNSRRSYLYLFEHKKDTSQRRNTYRLRQRDRADIAVGWIVQGRRVLFRVMPLVMHGGSGVSPEDYRTGIAYGLRKINYYSYMSKAGTNAVREMLNGQDVTFFHDLAMAAQNAMQADAEKAMRIFMGA